MRELKSHRTQSLTRRTLIISYIIPEQTNQTLNLNEAFGVCLAAMPGEVV